MTLAPTLDAAPSSAIAARALKMSGVAWFVAAAIGQLAFVYFLIAYYGARTAAGNFAGWNEKPLIDGHIPGDAVGNLMFIAHIGLAVVVTLGGLIQLVPAIRRRARALHRWNGRVFLVTAFAAALGGVWLTWGRGTHLSVVSGAAITGNAVLILVFGAMAWRRAAQRRIEDHRHWAMRAFLMVNGVWFLRVGLMAWVIIHQGPYGMNRTLSGPADIFLVFGCYLIPLAVFEIYARAQRSSEPRAKFGAAGLVFTLTGVMALGIFGTVAFMWGPYL